MAFEDCIRRARDDDEIDDDTARYLFQRYRNETLRMPAARAQQNITDYLNKAAEHTERMKLIQVVKWQKMMKDVSSYRGPHGEADIIEGARNLFENQGFGGMTSVRGYREGLIAMLNADLANALDAFERSFFLGRRNTASHKVIENELVDAAFGKKVSPRSQGFYDAFSGVFETLRQLRNERGGNTPKLDNWGLPQYHNPEAVNRGFGEGKGTIIRRDKAKADWTKYINDRVDFTQMFDNVTGEKFPANMSRAEQDQISSANWVNIGTDGWLSDPENHGIGGGALGRQRMDHRFYVFKSPEAWMEYNRNFGSGSAFQAIMNHFHGMASEVALMERFGPNPAGNINALKEAIKIEGRKFLRGEPSLLKIKDGALSGGITHTNLSRVLDRAFQDLDSYYDQYRGGGTPARSALALTGTIIRNWAGSALMGSAIIPHVATNPYIQYKVRTIAGIPSARTIPSILRSFSGSSRAELLRAGVNLEAGIGDLNAGPKQLSMLQKATNLSHWLPDRVVHVTQLARVLDAIKSAFYRDAMARLGDQQHLPWDKIDKDFRARLQGHGVTEKDWRIIQLAKPYEPVPGSAPWVRFNDVQRAGVDRPNDVLDIVGRSPQQEKLNLEPGETSIRDLDRARRAAHMSAWRLSAYMQGEREIMVPTHSMRAHSWLYGKSDPNMLSGQILRSFGQFKGFVGSFSVAQAALVQWQLAGNRWRGLAYLASGAISLVVLQMLAMQLKAAKNGRDFMPMDPTTRTGQMTWLRALFSSLTFGYGGEALVSDQTSYGHGWAESLLGPEAELVAGTGFDVLDAVRQRG